MEFITNEGKNVEKVVDGRVYRRHIIHTDYAAVGTSLDSYIEKYVLPICEKDDLIYLSKKLVSVCIASVLYKHDIKIGFWAQKLNNKILLTTPANAAMNPYLIQAAIYLNGITKTIEAINFPKINPEITKQLKRISGLDGTYYNDYEDFAIFPPVGADELCLGLRKKYGLNVFIASVSNTKADIVGISRSIKIPIETLEQVIADNPLEEGNTQTPICIIRPEPLEEEKKETQNISQEKN